MPITTRELYLAIARASEEPEPREGWPEHTGTDYPLDAPDHDWPDSPHPNDAPPPEVNDEAPSVVVIYLAACAFVILASLTYLAAQVNW